MSRDMTYTGTEPIDQPGSPHPHWEPGDTFPVDDEQAERWDTDHNAPFSGARKKAAKEARDRAAAEAAQAETAQAAPPAQEAPQ